MVVHLLKGSVTIRVLTSIAQLVTSSWESPESASLPQIRIFKQLFRELLRPHGLVFICCEVQLTTGRNISAKVKGIWRSLNCVDDNQPSFASVLKSSLNFD